MSVVVRRSAVKMWLLAMGGIPLLVISLDVLTNRRLTNWLRELIFTPEDTQIFEPRDVIWAWAMLFFAAFLVLWGLKELFWPTRILTAGDEGVAIRVGGPLRPPVTLPWDTVADVRSGHVEEEERNVPVLVLEVRSPTLIGDDPWGARWTGERQLSIYAEDWSERPGKVAKELRELAERSSETPHRAHVEERRRD